jgi:hypothetical protein
MKASGVLDLNKLQMKNNKHRYRSLEDFGKDVEAMIIEAKLQGPKSLTVRCIFSFYIQYK